MRVLELDGGRAWSADATAAEALRPVLSKLGAVYLAREKRRGRALDPVANFHLRNGACVGGVNHLGDPSAAGLRASAGLMVNYVYELDAVARRNEAYVERGEIDASPEVARLLEPALEHGSATAPPA